MIKPIHMLLVILITFPFLTLDTTLKALSFFLHSLSRANEILPIRTQKSFGIFKISILKFIRLSPNSVFNCDDHKGIRLITWLWVGLSHLYEHKLKWNSKNYVTPICSCGLDITLTSCFLFHCPIFNNERYNLMNT